MAEMVEAYDLAATDYDQRVEGDAWMRRVLWEDYTRLFGSGQVVLDVGCGTGIDALFLARQGIRVVGVDASPAMIVEAELRLERARLAELVEMRLMDIGELSALPTQGFDGIISAFAALSDVADLEGFAANAGRLLRPRGTALLHLLNRTSLWELLGLVRRGRWRDARRLGQNRERNFVIGGRNVQHYLYHARELYGRCFQSRFTVRRAYGLGILRPPHTIHRIPPGLVQALDSLERPLRDRPPFADWGRFFVLELEKR